MRACVRVCVCVCKCVCVCVSMGYNASCQIPWVYRQVMFTNKTKQMFTKQKFTKQNDYRQVMYTKQNKIKGLQTRYVYKTKYKTESLQNETKVYKHVMFTKQNTKQKFINTLCLQNKTQNKSL